MTLAWIADQIQAMKPDTPNLVRFNPRPPGVIQPGSASEAVLQILRAQPGRFYTCQQLIEKTGRTHAAVSWACIYLRDLGLVQAVSDGARNPRFLRYRIVKE
jgi:hypothetical protein